MLVHASTSFAATVHKYYVTRAKGHSSKQIHFNTGRASVYGTLWLTKKTFAFKVTRVTSRANFDIVLQFFCFNPLGEDQHSHSSKKMKIQHRPKTYKLNHLCDFNANEGYLEGILNLYSYGKY
jgi:hypothetical protein